MEERKKKWKYSDGGIEKVRRSRGEKGEVGETGRKEKRRSM